MFGVLRVTVAPGSANPPAQVVLRPLRTARGRILLDASSDLGLRPGDITLMLRPTDFESGPIAPGPGRSRVTAADWRFEMPNLASIGLIRTVPIRGWALKSVRIGGAEYLDRPFEFPKG